MRLIVEIPDELHRQVKAMSTQTGVPIAKVVRAALTQFVVGQMPIQEGRSAAVDALLDPQAVGGDLKVVKQGLHGAVFVEQTGVTDKGPYPPAKVSTGAIEEAPAVDLPVKPDSVRIQGRPARKDLSKTAQAKGKMGR
jgi:hypothetical protein